MISKVPSDAGAPVYTRVVTTIAILEESPFPIIN